MEPDKEIIIEGDRADDLRQDRLWFLESMDLINRAIQSTDDFGQVSHVLDAVLGIFGCDRAWIVYPCDPEGRTYRTEAQRARPEVTDSAYLQPDVPMNTEVAQVHRAVRASDGAVRFGPVGDNPLPSSIVERFGVQSQMCQAVRPKIDKPYLFGLDQCTRVRIWTGQEQRLFEAIGQRLATLLASLLMSRDLQESKARLEEAQRIAHIGHWEWNLETNVVAWSAEIFRIYGLTPQDGPVDLAAVSERIHPEDREFVFRTAEESIRSGVPADCEHRILRPDGEIRTIHSLGEVNRDASGRPYRMWGTVQDITDRKRAEESLRRTQFYLSEGERLAHMGSWASSNLGISWSDDLGLYWSDEVYRIFGLDPKNGAPGLEQCLAYVHSEDRAFIAEKVKAMHEEHCTCDLTHRIVRPDGELRYIRVVSNPVVEQGAFKGYIGITIDVTDQELLTQELRRQQAYLAEAQSLTHNGSWACNLVKRQIFHSSDENARLYGFDPSQGPIPFERYYNTILAEDESRVRVTLEDTIRAGKDYDVEFRIRRTYGAIRFMRGIGHHNPSGEAGDYVGITMDITEHELLTQELRRQQAYLAEAQSLTHVGSWACNFLTGKMFHLSDEALRLYGVDPGAPGISFERLYNATHPEDEPALREQFYGAINERRDYDIEYRIVRPDGAIRCLRSLGHHDASQELGEYVGITMDITDQKRAEKERERLRQLEADLAHINRVNMMGELAAALAHEIKQPIAASITSANACLRWLAHDPPDLERARAAAARIEQEGNRAADIINSLRSFYKMGTPAERQSVDVQGAIGEMAALLRTEAARHAVTIRAECQADMPHIVADRVQLQQVLMNLMLNAIEAMKDTGGELAIRSRVSSEGHLTVSISDTGVGLPADSADLIFDPFHTTKPQGTGMGLTITRSIVESYGGRVWATANKGAGATFHFTLPTGAEAHA